MLLTLSLPVILLVVSLFYLARYLSFSLWRFRAQRNAGCRAAPRLPQSPWRRGADVQELMARIKADGQQTRTMQSLFDKHGRTFQATVWGQPWLWTSDVEVIKAINTTHFSDFCVEPLRKPANSGWMGDGIFVSDGESWKASRALFKPLFARVGGLGADVGEFERHVRAMLDHALPRDGSTVELQQLFRKMYLDASFTYLFGSSPGTLAADGTEDFDTERFHAAFEAATIGMSRRHAMGRALRWADTGEAQWRKECAYVHSVFDSYIDAAIRQHETAREGPKSAGHDEKEQDGHPTSMLASLVQLTQDRVFLRDQLLNVFLGAKDTATIGISDVFFNLARHPQVWQKLRAEVASSARIAALGPDEPLDLETFADLPYLHNVLRESLRLLAPVDRLNRVCARDTILPRGGGPDGTAPLFVRAGSRIEARLSPMHRDAKFWGADAEQFMPERWEQWAQGSDARRDEGIGQTEKADLRSDAAAPPRWEYVPFSGGARICPARQMTLVQYAVILVRFVQRFERVDSRDPEPLFIEEVKFGKQSANGVLVGLVEG